MGENKVRALLKTIFSRPQTIDAPPREYPKRNSAVVDAVKLDVKGKETLLQSLDSAVLGKPVDDKKLLLENLVSTLQGLPASDTLGQDATNALIAGLWSDLPHPPRTLVGPATRYRSADGSGNSLWNPELGKAGTPYARNVPPQRPKTSTLPDPGLVFDALLKRPEDKFEEHPSGLNRLFFSFATVVIHECFQSNSQKPWINDTSSYVDLSTLYGNDQAEQDQVRTRVNGLIYPDTIASRKIMMMPPGVVAVLLLFARNHNKIATNLLAINEKGKYKDWDSLDEQGKKTQDEDIFQLSRNINVGFFATVVLEDYVAAILNTLRANSQWWINLGDDIKVLGQRVDRGRGNVVSCEFAVLYHWHAALSAADETWMEQLIKSYFPDLKDTDDLTPEMFYQMMGQYEAKYPADKRSTWSFAGLERQQDGSFKDSDLASIITSCIEEPAHKFGARSTPHTMKIIEVLSQLQARDVFNVCTLNEFRHYLNLKPYDSFNEWNPDKEVAKAAELLYGDIDDLELYPGLMAEVTKPAMPGSGLCPGQTTGRGLLDDAVALIRGDRFLSVDFNSSTLTNWGSAKVNSPAGGANGGMLAHVLFSALPWSFKGTSVYALYPFYQPKVVTKILQDNKAWTKKDDLVEFHMYDTAAPADRSIVSVKTQAACKQVFSDVDTFKTMYDPLIKDCTNDKGFMLGFDQKQQHDKSSAMLYKVFYEPDFEQHVSKFYSDKIRGILQKESYSFSKGKRTIDIVKHVTNVVPILWLAERFGMPLKTDEHPFGLITPTQLFEGLVVIALYVGFNIIPVNEWALRDGVMQAAPALRQIFAAHMSMTNGGLAEKATQWLAKGSSYELCPDALRIYHALRASDVPQADLVSDCLGICTPAALNLTQQPALLIDLFLSEQCAEYLPRIRELALSDTPEAFKELQGYVFEGMRLACAVAGSPRVATKDTTIRDGEREVHVRAGQTVLVATALAAMDPIAFPNPEKLDPSRKWEDYSMLGWGLHRCFGGRVSAVAITQTVKEVFRLPGLRRAKGRQGQFAMIWTDIDGVPIRQYVVEGGQESPVPTSLVLEYDD